MARKKKRTFRYKWNKIKASFNYNFGIIWNGFGKQIFAVFIIIFAFVILLNIISINCRYWYNKGENSIYKSANDFKYGQFEENRTFVWNGEIIND